MSSRTEETFSQIAPNGVHKEFILVPFVVPEDVMTLAAKAVAAEIKLGVVYESPGTKEVRDHLILSQVTNRS